RGRDGRRPGTQGGAHRHAHGQRTTRNCAAPRRSFGNFPTARTRAGPALAMRTRFWNAPFLPARPAATRLPRTNTFTGSPAARPRTTIRWTAPARTGRLATCTRSFFFFSAFTRTTGVATPESPTTRTIRRAGFFCTGTRTPTAPFAPAVVTTSRAPTCTHTVSP